MKIKKLIPIIILLLTLQIGFSASDCNLYIITDRGILSFLESLLHFVMNLLMCWTGLYVLLFFIAIAGIILMVFGAFKKW